MKKKMECTLPTNNNLWLLNTTKNQIMDDDDLGIRIMDDDDLGISLKCFFSVWSYLLPLFPLVKGLSSAAS